MPPPLPRAASSCFRRCAAACPRRSVCSLWTTCRLLHGQWFGPDEPALPPTPNSIFAVAACFKVGGYTACPSHMSKAKEHVMAGHPWGPQLDLAASKAAMSVTRGLGAARQSAPFDLSLALKAINGGKVALPAGTPIGWGNLVVTATYFVTREI